MKKVTLEQIGKKLNISKVAVFKALNNQPGISIELRKKVQEMANQLGYIPPHSKYLSGLQFLFAVQKKFYLTTAEQFYNLIFSFLGLECKSIDSSLDILFIDQNSPPDIVEKAIEEKNCSGIKISGVFIAGEVSDTILEHNKNCGIPTIVLDYYSPLHKLTYIYLDNYNMSYAATNYLIE